MLYYLFEWLQQYNFPGAGLFNYISFRAAAAAILALVITMLLGKPMINFIRKKQIGEDIRDLGLEGQMQKKGTPTMGGIIIILAILLPTLFFTKLNNIYIILMIFTTIWLGVLGFTDDYIKVFKKNKEGLSGKNKIIAQIVLGLVVALVMCFHPDVQIRELDAAKKAEIANTTNILSIAGQSTIEQRTAFKEPSQSTKTTIPFVKNNEFDYAWISQWFGDEEGKWKFLFLIPIFIFIIVGVSNGANLTDGLDGLAAGTCAIIAVGIALLAYVSGNFIFADYLNIMFIPNISEIVIFSAALIGACIGFYWYNCFPAQIFMGDTGSLMLGGVIAVLCIIIRKELLIPILCGVFLIQSISVILQVSYFKYTRKKYGEGRRLFLMSPLHHHYQKKGFHESKIVQRFIVISILLVVLTLVTLKIR